MFLGFEIDDGASLVASPSSSSRKIEFIGDSITCGYVYSSFYYYFSFILEILISFIFS